MSRMKIGFAVIILIVLLLIGWGLRGWGGAVIGLFAWLFIAGLIDLTKMSTNTEHQRKF